tara:strand:- start:490 stop:1317 length:828 start_codon:yes stop_codon:yes gene_type:complete
MTKYYAFFVSDGTRVTAATLGNSLLTQFKNTKFEKSTISFVEDKIKAEAVLTKLNKLAVQKDTCIFIFATIVNADVLAIISKADAVFMDILNTFIQPIETALGVKSSHDMGLTHGVKNYDQYHHRIDAVNFTLNSDDGLATQTYHEADLILVGVSRCGKTPTSLYLALHFGLQVANYPLDEDEVDAGILPPALRNFKNKIIGLTIAPDRLHQVRQKRRPDSHYAQLRQCRHETQGAEAIFIKEQLPYLDTSNRSIEEIGATIIALMKKENTWTNY